MGGDITPAPLGRSSARHFPHSETTCPAICCCCGAGILHVSLFGGLVGFRPFDYRLNVIGLGPQKHWRRVPLRCAGRRGKNGRTGLDTAEGYSGFSKDDEQATRIAALALSFMSSDTISDKAIWHSFYPDLTKADSYRTAFRRDRMALAECGIMVSRVDGPETLWRVDSASFVENTELSDEDAMALDVACLPLVDDPDFPYGAELRIALSKIDDTFDNPASVTLPAEERVPSRQLATLQECNLSGQVARMDYERVDGTTLQRQVAPYGFFGLRGHLYMVAPTVDENGVAVEGSTHTYRIDRVKRVSKVTGTSFCVPEDFDIRDWRKLPFQLGPVLCEGVFAVPAQAIREFSQATQGKGTFLEPGATPHAAPPSDGEHSSVSLLWQVEISGIEDAASWAIAEDIVPISPQELVAAWRSQLEGVVAYG